MAAVGAAGAIAHIANKNQRRLRTRRPSAAGRVVKERLDDYELGWFEWHTTVSVWMRRLLQWSPFEAIVMLVVLIAGLLVGASTYEDFRRDNAVLFAMLDEIIMGVFISEVAIKILAEGRRPYEYFRDGWNLFDFVVVAAGFAPIRVGNSGATFSVLRLARVLRVMKMVRSLPRLRVIVVGLIKALSSITYIGSLLLIIFYVYGVLGVTLFAANDPVHFGSLHLSMLTLFRCATLEDWADVMYTQMQGCDRFGYYDRPNRCTSPDRRPVVAVLYFMTYVVLSAMMIMNMFVGVIMSSMEAARVELAEENVAGESAPASSAAAPALLRSPSRISFTGSFRGVPDQLQEDQQALERLQELADLASKVRDEIDHLWHVEVEREVRTKAKSVVATLRNAKQRRVRTKLKGAALAAFSLNKSRRAPAGAAPQQGGAATT